MEVPKIQFAETEDDLRIAYRTFGDGPPLVIVPIALSAIESYWWPGRMHDMWERLGANLRCVIFDHRGSGLSDGFESPPTLAERSLDIRAVMAAAGMDRASLWGFMFGSQVAVAFAFEHPDRVERLVLTNSRVGRSAGEVANKLAPEALPPSPNLPSADNLGALDKVGVEIDEEDLLYNNPSIDKHPDVVEQLLMSARMVGSRSAQKQQTVSVTNADIVEIAPQVEAPTLIVHSVGTRVHHVGFARYLEQLMPNATLLELPGNDMMYWLSDNWKDYVDPGIRFVSNETVDAPLERAFSVVVFTDIVRSTATSVDSGDSEWRARLDLHDRISGRVVAGHGGTIVKNTGDGILAVFDMPSDALDAAVELTQDLSTAAISIRTGIHAGEVELRGSDISGATVNLAARVEQAAADGHIFVTKTIRDMLIGTRYNFEDAGSHVLKGFDDEWRLFRVMIA